MLTKDQTLREEWKKQHLIGYKQNPKKYEETLDFFLAHFSEQKRKVLEEVETLCTKFPVRDSDEFDQGRESMKREVKEIINNIL